MDERQRQAGADNQFDLFLNLPRGAPGEVIVDVLKRERRRSHDAEVVGGLEVLHPHAIRGIGQTRDLARDPVARMDTALNGHRSLPWRTATYRVSADRRSSSWDRASGPPAGRPRPRLRRDRPSVRPPASRCSPTPRSAGAIYPAWSTP